MTICKKCVMDDQNDKNINFDQDGVCNYCKTFASKKNNFIFSSEDEKSNLEEIKKKILKLKNNEYDIITGISGGVDSSYLIYLIKKLN